MRNPVIRETNSTYRPLVARRLQFSNGGLAMLTFSNSFCVPEGLISPTLLSHTH